MNPALDAQWTKDVTVGLGEYYVDRVDSCVDPKQAVHIESPSVLP